VTRDNQRSGKAAPSALGSIELEIIRGKLSATSDEMGVVLSRASMSPVIYEILDFACGICDAEGQLISQTNGITVFTGTFSAQVQAIKRKHKDTIRSGDIFISNDPFEGNTHNADVAIIKPVFFDGELIAFAIAMAHWTELGGMVPGTLSPQATEAYQEGLRLTGLRIFREGVRQDDLFELIAENVRLPTMSLGDLNAELAAARIGDTRLREICTIYGPDVLKASFERILATGEAASRKAIAALPDGVYEAHDKIDGDGISEEQIPIQVKVTIAGDEITFDFTGSSPQRDAPVNCTRGALYSATKTILKAMVDPGAPSNEGWFRPMKVIAPDGTVFTAMKPAATGWYFEVTAHATELIWMALAKLVPERLSAGSYMSLCGTYIGGKDAVTGQTFVVVEPHIGGWGAMRNADGVSALISTPDGDTYNYSIELFEAKFPLRVNQYSLNVESGAGAGRYRGGFGAIREYEILSDNAFMYSSLGRSQETPWGVDGGGNGTSNAIELTQGDHMVRGARFPFTKLKSGDRMRVITGGGGGYGLPTDRPPAEVLADVRDGYIDLETARSVYKVSITGDHAVNEAETAILRGI
jgi:N-methylhydantoinase B